MRGVAPLRCTMLWYEWLAAAFGAWCLIQCVSVVVARYYMMRAPFPESVSKITTISDLHQWEALVREAVTAGDLVLVDCYATWCPPCRTSIPHLTETQAKFKDRGVNIVGVTNEDLDTVEPFVKKMGKKMDYTVVIDDNRELSNKYMKKYGVNGIPHAFVIKDGEVVWHDHPMRDLDGAIEDALK